MLNQIIPFINVNNARIYTIGWLKEHLDEFKDTDKIMDLRGVERESKIRTALESYPTEEELDKMEKAELESARNSFK